METLANLESFVRSAKAGNFSVAARALALTPAAVSRNVAMLCAGRRSAGLTSGCRSLARNFGRFAPKAANPAASLWSMIFQYPKFGMGACRPRS
jgi:hypothetical protein